MKIVIRQGYQYFDLGDDNYALIFDGDGEPLQAESREWIETEIEYVLYPKMAKNDKKKLH